jgi:hypothetical protein
MPVPIDAARSSEPRPSTRRSRRGAARIAAFPATRRRRARPPPIVVGRTTAPRGRGRSGVGRGGAAYLCCYERVSHSTGGRRRSANRRMSCPLSPQPRGQSNSTGTSFSQPTAAGCWQLGQVSHVTRSLTGCLLSPAGAATPRQDQGGLRPWAQAQAAPGAVASLPASPRDTPDKPNSLPSSLAAGPSAPKC